MAIYKNIALLPVVHSLEKLRSNKIRYSTRIFFLSFFFSFVFFFLFFFLEESRRGMTRPYPRYLLRLFQIESSCNTNFDLNENEAERRRPFL